MKKYSGEQFSKTRYDFAEIEEELKVLDNFEIGIMFDKSVRVFEAIERLQSGSVIGFLFQLYENKYTARLDDPNRIERDPISHLEILNLHEVEVDWNASLYGTYTNIEYAHNYSEGICRNVINRDSQKKILVLHRMDKEWKAETLLSDQKDAELKSKILLEDFEEMRPIIKNIKLSGEKWFGLDEKTAPLRVYDILEIDFRIPGEEVDKYPHHIIRLISEVGEEKAVGMGRDANEYIAMIDEEKETTGERVFAGSLRCQVMRVESDTKTGVTTIDVRATEENKAWRKR
jgi:hypothetical protein